MSRSLEVLVLMLLLAVRMGVPVVIMCFVCCGLRRCERRWDAEAARLHVSPR